jgi:hypothetical protein
MWSGLGNTAHRPHIAVLEHHRQLAYAAGAHSMEMTALAGGPPKHVADGWNFQRRSHRSVV